MPQFDPSAFITQIFWLVICFAAVFFALSRRAIPQIASIFSERSKRIEGQLKTADGLKSEAAKIAEQVDDQLTKARLEASARINVAFHEVSLANTQRKNEFTSIQKRRLKASEKNIARKKQEAYDEVKTIASEAALSMTEVLASVKVSPQKANEILESLLSESAEFSKADVKVSNV